ncbi:rihA [Symbiodinium sp. CCMP2456]|nr:rihA [Symbiodinium sp. CCMP2456]
MHALLCMLGILLGTAGSASKGAAIPSYQDQCSDGSVGKICSTHRRIQRRSSAPVILDHDGNYDDILVLLVLLNFRPAVDLKAVLVTPADCELEPAVDVSSTVLSMFGHDAPVLPGNFPARFNEFPRVWRELASEMQQVADIYLHASASSRPKPKPAVTAEEWLADYLLKAEEEENKTDFVITGPATNLASTLKQHPELIRKVGTVLWMGGAVDVNGNVRDDDQRPQESDGTAEWNAFWDPEATRDLLKLGLDLRLVPLDATDDVPVTKDFIRRLDPTLEVARTARQIWAQSKFQKSNAVYYMWDTLTVPSRHP